MKVLELLAELKKANPCLRYGQIIKAAVCRYKGGDIPVFYISDEYLEDALIQYEAYLNEIGEKSSA